MSVCPKSERLRVLLDVGKGLPYVSPSEVLDYLSDDDLEILAFTDENDLSLANACLEVEAEARGREHAAFGQLGTALVVAPGGSSWPKRVSRLPNHVRARALAAVMDLGWVDS